MAPGFAMQPGRAWSSLRGAWHRVKRGEMPSGRKDALLGTPIEALSVIRIVAHSCHD